MNDLLEESDGLEGTKMVTPQPSLSSRTRVRFNYNRVTHVVEFKPDDVIGDILEAKINDISTPGKKRTKYDTLQIFCDKALVNPGLPASWFSEFIVDVQFSNGNQDFLGTRGDYSGDGSKQHTFFILDQSAYVSKKLSPSKLSFPGPIRVDTLIDVTYQKALEKDNRFIANIVTNGFTLSDLDESESFEHYNIIVKEDIEGKVMKMKSSKSSAKKDAVEVDAIVKNEKCIEEGLHQGDDMNKSTSNPSKESKADENEVKKDAVEVDARVKNEKCMEEGLYQGDVMNKSTSNPSKESKADENEDSNVRHVVSLMEFNSTAVEKILQILEYHTEVQWTITPKAKSKEKKEFKCRIEKYSSHINVAKSTWLNKKLVTYYDHVGILWYNENRGSGTIFVVGKIEDKKTSKVNLYLMTNAHVVEGNSNANVNSSVWGTLSFSYEIQSDTNKIMVLKENVRLVCQDCKIDYALIELTFKDDEPCGDQNWHGLKQYAKKMKHGLGKYAKKMEAHKWGNLQIVGHPNGGIKTHDVGVILHNAPFEPNINSYLKHPEAYPIPKNIDAWRDPNNTLYNCNSFHGASGSPCFDDHGDLVCMHTSGVYLDTTMYDMNRPSCVEFGIKISAIVDDMKTKIDTNCVNGLDFDTLKILFPNLCTEEKMEIDP